jgi:hypothetical protein
MTAKVISSCQPQSQWIELTGITEVCRFGIWSSTEDGTESWCNINDTIVFQVYQLVLSVSPITQIDAVRVELPRHLLS